MMIDQWPMGMFKPADPIDEIGILINKGTITDQTKNHWAFLCPKSRIQSGKSKVEHGESSNFVPHSPPGNPRPWEKTTHSSYGKLFLMEMEWNLPKKTYSLAICSIAIGPFIVDYLLKILKDGDFPCFCIFFNQRVRVLWIEEKHQERKQDGAKTSAGGERWHLKFELNGTRWYSQRMPTVYDMNKHVSNIFQQ